MRPSFLLPVILPFGLATANLVPALADRTLLADPQPRAERSQFLGKRQFCPFNDGFCTADDGSTICLAADEVCCQYGGNTPFTCPMDYPFCCGPDATTGILLCGSDSSCGAGAFLSAPAAQQPTVSTGVAGPTATAQVAPTATTAQQSAASTGVAGVTKSVQVASSAGSSSPTSKPTGAAVRMNVDMGLAGGVILAAVGAIL